ncbi:hypothetical protein HDU87_006100 [Geranomyces variabilis]|uniref:Uncharacterized protein n=1 Tax=Geranomyces variabilis TaxID=109894 RepID=A0AAD5TID0_9FUNG|nr:hypothetical protein HDU87_006100 [Geranomyces variabilis]
MHSPRTPVKPKTGSRPPTSPLDFSSPLQFSVSPNTLAWRERFKAQCLSNIKESRQAEVTRRRFGNQGSPLGKKRWEAAGAGATAEVRMEQEAIALFIADQWRLFRTQARALGSLPPELEEEIMREVGGTTSQWDDELLAAYESSLIADDRTSHLVRSEEDSAAEAAAAFESERPVCFVCQKGLLTLERNGITCPACRMVVEAQPGVIGSVEGLISHVKQLCANHQ